MSSARFVSGDEEESDQRCKCAICLEGTKEEGRMKMMRGARRGLDFLPSISRPCDEDAMKTPCCKNVMHRGCLEKALAEDFDDETVERTRFFRCPMCRKEGFGQKLPISDSDKSILDRIEERDRYTPPIIYYIP